MQLPYSWITELVEITWPAKELASRLTLCGTAAEASRFAESDFSGITVGRIAELEPIAGSDHLKRAIVDTGDEKVPVVCGAPNAAKGQKVVFARIGAHLKDGMEIKKVKLRGVESYGMICSEAELGLTDDHSGIIVLDDDAPIGEPIDKYLELNDYILKFDLTPNRGDSLSAIGVARDVACLAGSTIKRPEYKLKEATQKAADILKISIDDSSACPRYAARLIKGVKVGPSPWWIKRKLLLCGIRPISNIVDITNLIMMELGHPLHAFDFRHFGRGEVLVRRAREGEKFITLDNKEHKLTSDVLLITDGDNGVAAAGVMGGLHSEVEPDTTDILLESAYFDPVTTRKSRTRLGLVTESSMRFEKGADPNIVPEAVNRAAYLIQKYGGGEILQGIVDSYPRKIESIMISLRPARVNGILGNDVQVERMVNILKGLEFAVTHKECLEVTVPTFRPDVTREIDLIEEIARIDGYDKIPSADRNIGSLFTPTGDDDIFRRIIRNTMTGLGFDEIYGPGMADAAMLSRLTGNLPSLKILNPIAEDLSVMQNSLIYSLMRAVSNNLAHRNIELRLFEIGKSFLRSGIGGGNPLSYEEVEEIGLAISGKSDDKWYGKGREYDFFDLKGAIDSLLETGRISAVKYIPTESLPYRKGYAFGIDLDGREIGHCGQVDPETARFFDVKQPVFVAVLNFDMLLKSRLSERSYEPLPKFPAAPRDMALVVDEKIEVGAIISVIREIGGSLLEEVKLFDLYKGKQIGEGKKSLAFTMVFRSGERSLESGEVADIQYKIATHLKEHFKAEVREG